MALLVQFGIGILFGLGLLVAGMSDPAKVLNFLDLGAIGSGGWDPSLAFVMVGAIAVTFTGYRWVLRRERPFFDTSFHLAPAARLDLRRLTGPVIFGMGWGIAGFCPAPALTALTTGGGLAWAFLGAMLVGKAAARWLARTLGAPPEILRPADATLAQPQTQE